MRRWCALCVVPLLLLSSPVEGSEILRIGGSGADLASMRQIADAFTQARPEVEVRIPPSMGSGGAVNAVAAGALDIGLTSRPLLPREQALVLHVVHYAKTPLVFAVHRARPETGFTTEELLEVYSGKRRHWGDGRRLRLLLRPESDSDVLVLRQALPRLGPALRHAYRQTGIPVIAEDQETADKIADVPGALGTSTLALILAENRPLKALALDGVVPSLRSIADGSYPLAKDLYFVLKPKSSPLARDFLAFVSSPAGAAILEKTGHLIADRQAQP